MRRPPRFDHIPPDEPRWREGARRFNTGAFFESHDVWESLWHAVGGPERELLQGLIQLAAAYHHRRRGNTTGAQRLYATGRARVAPWAPRHAGMRLDALLADVDRAFAPAPGAPLPPRTPLIRFDDETRP